MSEVVLIAGSETLLGRKIVEKELARGNRVAAPVNSSKESGSGESSRENLLVVPWNRSSLFSAKTVIQETVRLWGIPDRAYIIDNSNRETAPFTDLSLADLDDTVDREIKGFLYLTNQLINTLKKKNSSSLFFIRPHHSKSESGMDRGMGEFFRELADGIMRERLERLQTAGFISSTANAESCAESILEYASDLPEKARGEWLKISEKRNLFLPLPLEKRN
ncbi:MAG: hypothetical protein PQJ59_11910 [Spirochaetales bacterium]|nr:hypothetical protein [Spirochaetales bacterium]